MSRIIIALCLTLLTPGVYAQSDKFEFGFSVPLSIKSNLAYGENGFQRAFGSYGIDALLKINGVDENSMSFIMGVGLTEDVRPFRLDVSSKFNTKLSLLKVNAMVVIPSKWPHIQYNLGIGTLVGLGERVVFTSDAGQVLYNTNVDSVADILAKNSKGAIPFVSIGIAADVSRKFKLQFSVEPTLMDFYYPGTHVNYIATATMASSQHDFIMAYQPVYIGVKVYYFIRAKG